MQNLLRFPQAMSPSAAFGSSVHAVLQKAHAALSATGKKRPVEDLLADFDHELERHHLSSDEFEYFSGRGADVLSAFFAARYDTFTASQQVERSFGTETVVVGEARLTGALDLIDIDVDAKTIVVTDYKTGKPSKTWQGKSPYEKIKLHHYRQQLLFYKLLVENSRQYAGFTVTRGVIEFVEPDSAGTFHRLEVEYDIAELQEFTELIQAVWASIHRLEFDANDSYSPDLIGIEKFEKYLRAHVD
jgi:DNA helicase-2/ATP-dependent DNA helicase PcrA